MCLFSVTVYSYIYSHPVDKAKGIELITMAADNGLQIAQANLGLQYYNGNGVEVSYSLALKYFKLALTELQENDKKYSLNGLSPLSDEQRNNIMYVIASCYLGNGPDQSAIDSYYWFKKYLSTHPSSCKGCDKELRAKKLIDAINKDLTSRCSTCNKKKGGDLPMMICSGCRVVSYCTKECQRAGWGSHKEICKQLKELIAEKKG